MPLALIEKLRNEIAESEASAVNIGGGEGLRILFTSLLGVVKEVLNVCAALEEQNAEMSLYIESVAEAVDEYFLEDEEEEEREGLFSSVS